MTTKTLAVPVELLERLAAQKKDRGWIETNTAITFKAALELRELLDQHPLIKCLNENGDLIAASATIAQQAEYIRLLEARCEDQQNTIEILRERIE